MAGPNPAPRQEIPLVRAG